MARLFTYLLLFLLIGYGLWPYYTVFRLDSALTVTDPKAIAPLVDLQAIQQHYKERFGKEVKRFIPRDGSNSERMLDWLAQNLDRLGDGALHQAITDQWVWDTLRASAERGTDKRPAYFINAVDFAFFESWNRFVIRLGRLGGETHVVLGLDLEHPIWRVTDVVR